MAELTKAARLAVLVRDNYQCQACGIRISGWHSIQHRKARGQGGTNALTNLVLLCGSATSKGCHLKCESRDGVMHERGFWCFSWQDPSNVPLRVYDGTVRLLDDDGNWRPWDGTDAHEGA